MDASRSPVVQDPSLLCDDHVPESFVGREEQTELLLSAVHDPVQSTLWVYGPPGAGKTSLVQRIVGDVERPQRRVIYINCWSKPTFYSVVDSALEELRILIGEQRDVSLKFERLSQVARATPLIIVLDELDQLYLKERNACLYNLHGLENTLLVCLSQTEAAYQNLDSRVQSRLQPQFIRFNAYDDSDLVSILEERATQALRPESWCVADLQAVVRRSAGDARVAIQSLRTAAYLAEKNRTLCLRASDIERGIYRATRLRKQFLRNELSDHQRLMFELVKTAGRITLKQLWKRYKVHTRRRGLEPRAKRTFNHYRQFLVHHRLLSEQQGRGQSNTRVLRVYPDEEPVGR